MKDKLIYIMTACLLFSCAEEIEVDAAFPDSLPVVEAYFDKSGAQQVFLSESLSPLENLNDLRYIDNATIRLLEGDSLLGTFYYNNLAGQVPFYQLDESTLQEGLSYSLEIEIPGRELIRAYDIMPFAQELNFINTLIPADPNSNNYAFGRYQLSLSLPESDLSNYELIARGNAAELVLDSNQLPIDTNYYIDTLLNLETIDGTYAIDIGSSSLINGELLEGSTINFDVGITQDTLKTLYLADSLFLELRSVSYNYYELKRTQFVNVVGLNSGFSEPIQIHSNTENAYGIFALYSKSELQIVR